MKKISLLIGLLLTQYEIADAQAITFNYTGSVQTYTVPACVTSITVDVQGAQGGLGPVGVSSNAGLGGLGGRTEATIPVNPGDVLTIYVGGQGAPDNNSSAAGGFNGGGDAMDESSYTYYGGGGGGGASDIRLNGNALTDRIVVAGGGGGGGADGCSADFLNGGAGGGLTGNPGDAGGLCSCNPSGQGGTQAAGGLQGDWACTCNATAGSFGQGGNSNSTSCGGPSGGAGGGGGYYGGGGGGLGAGGGGSNYTIGTATGVVNTVGYRNGDGLVMITPIGGAANPDPISGSASICENANGTYSISSFPGALTYTWTVPAGTIINSGQGTNSIDITAGSNSGNMDVTITYACGTTPPSTLALTVLPAPVIGLTVLPSTTVCAGTSVTLWGLGGTAYTWTGGESDGIPFIASSTDSYTVTGTDANGCTDTATTTVTVNPLPTVTANSSATAVCSGSQVTLTGGGAVSYTWDNSVADGVAFNPAATATYMVTGTDANGCVNTDMTTVTVNPLPTVDIGPDVTQCGGTVTLDAGNAGSTYAWSNSTSAQTVVVSTSGTYFVVVTDVNGCIDSDTALVTINTLPTVTGTASSNIVCFDDANVTLTGTPSNGTWSGAGVTGSSFDPSTAGNGAHTCTYTFTDVNGCTNTATVNIQVNACTGVVETTLNNNVNVFPNPASGSFTLSVHASVGDLLIELLDMEGRVVYSSSEKNVQAGYSKQISVENFANGIYMLRLTSSSEQRMEKITVQK